MLTPGPAKLYLVGVSIGRGRIGGLMIALGILTSDLVHVTLASVGVQVVFERYPGLFASLRYAGAGYLLYLAFKSMKRAMKEAATLSLDDVETDDAVAQYYLGGLLVNLFNPLALVFYLSLLPQFVAPDASLGEGTQMFMFGAVMVLGFFLFHVAIAQTAGAIEKKISSGSGSKLARYQGVVVAVVFTALALRLLTQSA